MGSFIYQRPDFFSTEFIGLLCSFVLNCLVDSKRDVANTPLPLRRHMRVVYNRKHVLVPFLFF